MQRPIVLFMAYFLGLLFPAMGQMLDHDLYRNPNGTRVVAASDARQSYMLYIPASVPKTGPCEILYAFDPGANGAGALQYMAAAAAKMGWIVAASNNSQNGAWSVIIAAERALMEDTELRLNLHPTRRFASGMSGGARASLALAAQYPDKVTGVVAMGAGDPNIDSLLPHSNNLAVYMLIGDQDTNIQYDVPDSHTRMLSEGIRSYVEVFSGGHVMPPVDRFQSACEWVSRYANDPPAHLGETSDSDAYVAQDPQPNFGAEDWYTIISEADGANVVMDNFTMMNAPIKQVGWWGLEATKNGNTWTSCARPSLRFQIDFYADDDGLPGELVASRTVTALRETTGYLYGIYPLLRYTAIFNQSVDLAAGWLRIGSLDSTTCRFYWLQGQGDNISAVGEESGFFESYYMNCSFYLAPENGGFNNQTLYEVGDTIRIHVPGVVARYSTFSWSFKGLPLADGVRVKGADQRELQVMDAQLSDTGKYSCDFDDGRNQKTAGKFTLNVQVVPDIPVANGLGLAALAGLLALGMRRALRAA